MTLTKERLRCLILNVAKIARQTERYKTAPLWVIVRDTFAHGSQCSQRICMDNDLNPDAEI
jgi:hypothetical protein